MIAVIVVHYGDVEVTIHCLDSLYRNAGCDFCLWLVNNDGGDASRHLLSDYIAKKNNYHLISNKENRGFAVACNQAIGEIVMKSNVASIALLNNDTQIEADWLVKMEAKLDSDNNVDMVASRMVDFDHPNRVQGLGITFYLSGLAYNRKTEQDTLLGPCGGAAMYSMKLIKNAIKSFGYVFDADFFCYSEDVDLALRARALGYKCAMADNAVVRHHGNHASGGAESEFVAYHGLRNSIITMIKNLPASFFFRNLGWILLMQGAIFTKYFIKGRPVLLWRIYRDAARRWPMAITHRKKMKQQWHYSTENWREYISCRFYDASYIKLQFRRDGNGKV